METLRWIFAAIAILLIFLFVKIIKKINKLDQEDDPLCLALYFPAMIIGLLFTADFVGFVATFG